MSELSGARSWVLEVGERVSWPVELVGGVVVTYRAGEGRVVDILVVVVVSMLAFVRKGQSDCVGGNNSRKLASRSAATNKRIRRKGRRPQDRQMTESKTMYPKQSKDKT